MQTFRVDLEEPLFLELPTGMRASLDLNVLRQAADVWFDSIIQLVNGLTIPNIEMDKKDYMRDNTFYIEQRLDGVTLTTDTAHNAVVLNCNKLTAKFRSNSFSYKIAPLMVAQGYVEVDMNTVDIGFGLGFTTQLAPDGRQLMAVTTVDVLVDINRNDIKLHIGGGFWTDLASIFTVFFKGTVVDLIRDSVSSALVTMIPTITNNALLANDAYFSLVPNWVWDWQSPNAAIVTDTRWELAIFGEMFDSRIGEVSPTGPFPTMPYSDSTKTAGLQAFVADWAVDDFFSTLIAIHPMAGWLNSTTLTTDLCNTFMPGISGAYGSGTPVNMYIDLSSIDNFDVNSNPEMGADFTVRLDFYPQLANGDFEEAASITLVQTNFTFTALIDDMDLSATIRTINVDKITANYCSWGTLHPTTMKIALNSAIKVMLPTINTALAAKHLSIPTHLGKYFILSDLTLDYFDGFMYLGFTPTFVGPVGETPTFAPFVRPALLA